MSRQRQWRRATRPTEYLRNRMCRKDPFVRHSRSSDRPIHIRDAPHSEADRSLALAYPWEIPDSHRPSSNLIGAEIGMKIILQG